MEALIAIAHVVGLLLAALARLLGCSGPPLATPGGAPLEIAPLPGARHGHRAELVGADVFVLGGYSRRPDAAHDGTTEVWSFNPAQGQWRRRADMPTGRSFFASAVVDARILAVGDSLDVYDPATDHWATLAGPDSFPRSHFAAAVVGRRLYVLGGFPTVMGGFLAFDLDTRRRIDLPEPPGFADGDHFHILVSLDGALHLFGGIAYKTFDTTPNHFTFDGERWASAAPSPEPLWAKFSALQAVGGELFVFGDSGAFKYAAAADRWSTAAPMDALLVMPASVAASGRIHVIGGLNVQNDSRSTSAIRTYDIAKNSWLTPP